MSENRILEYIQSLRISERLGRQVAAYEYNSRRPAQMRGYPPGLPSSMELGLSQLGIPKLYSHQLDAIDAVRKGEHVVVSTPTASGKSLIYNLPLFEHFIKDPTAGAIYVFPLKALTQDQLASFQKWAQHMGCQGATAAVYDGDTSTYRRRKIRQNPPNVIMTNPEMLHLAFLPHHSNWGNFFRGLKLVVIDEVHTYRGLLGCHMAQVLRRLLRICHYYGASPTFVCASATIGNPGYLAEQLTGLRVRSIENNGAPRGGRHMVIMDPADGPAQTAILLLKAAMARKLRTIVYTQSRKMAELITLWVQQQAGRFADKISVYRAGLLPKDRRRIESDLKSGKLLAVVSTSALELGIDIGDLDLCILVGYPGSVMAARQRSGRVGRKGQDAAVILLAGQDGLDQYFITHPDAYFKGRPETAVINPFNEVVLAAHLVCAAAELPLTSDEQWISRDEQWISRDEQWISRDEQWISRDEQWISRDGQRISRDGQWISQDEQWISRDEVQNSVAALEEEGKLLRSADGRFIHSFTKRPHHKVDLRSAGDRFQLFHQEKLVGEVNAFRLYRDTHVGAVYLHQGRTFVVQHVNEAEKSVHLKAANVDYYTRTSTHTDIDIQDVYEHKYLDNTVICSGKVKVTDHVTGFVRIQTRTGRILDRTELDVAPSIFVTDSMWFEFGSEHCDRVTEHGYDLLGSLHAGEHAAIGIMPLIILADRNDLGGLATPYQLQIGSAAIFIYDGIAGGAGLSRQAYHQTDLLINRVVDMISGCQCEKGCPACVQSPKCGSGNQPLDKDGGRFLFKNMRKPAKPYEKRIGRKDAGKAVKPYEKRIGRKDAGNPVEPYEKRIGRKDAGNPVEPYEKRDHPLHIPAPDRPKPASLTHPSHFCVFDLETQRSAAQVGGWHMAHQMRVSCGVVYDSRTDAFDVYMESDVEQLIEHLKQFEAVVGFNSKRFDYKVLSGYSDFDFMTLPSLDLLERVHSQLGFRLSLDHLAEQTLDQKKSGSGLDALKWWQAGEIQKIIEYCKLDVRITLDLYLHLRNNGYLIYRQKNGERFRVPINLLRS